MLDKTDIEKVEIEDSKPAVKLKKWGEECFLRVECPITKRAKQIAKNCWCDDNREFSFYPLEKEEGIEEKFEVEVILKKKPPTNKVVYKIETKGLKFYYQPKLTKQEIKRGARRPENVVGSYAVYHETQDKLWKTREEAEKYKAGKAFHIYRPKVKDNAGKETWGELNIDPQKGILTITIDQDWLNKARYPVIVDPTFGYTTIGASIISHGYDFIIRGSVFPLTEAGTGDSISVYTFSAMGAGGIIRGALYQHSDLSLVANGTTSDAAETGTARWETMPFPTAPFLSVMDYIIVAWGDGFQDAYFDAGNTNQGHFQSYSLPPDWPNSLVPTHDNNKYSIYCTYTVAAPPPPTFQPRGTSLGSPFIY